jgi:hypothetical protein
MILVKRDLTDEESMLLNFSNERTSASSEECIDLDIKKKFFYVISPDQKIIDLASIY